MFSGKHPAAASELGVVSRFLLAQEVRFFVMPMVAISSIEMEGGLQVYSGIWHAWACRSAATQTCAASKKVLFSCARQFHHILNYLRDGTLPIGALDLLYSLPRLPRLRG